MSAVEAVRQALSSIDHPFSDHEIRRVLRSRRDDVAKTVLFLKDKYNFLSSNYYLDISIAHPVIRKELLKGYAHLPDDCVTHEGSPVLLVQPEHFHYRDAKESVQLPNASVQESTGSDAKLLSIYLWELALDMAEVDLDREQDKSIFVQPLAQVTLLVDVQHMQLELHVGYIQFLHELFTTFQQYYPESLRQVLVIGGNDKAQSVIKWMQKVVQASFLYKVQVLNYQSELVNFIPHGSIPQMYGGKCSLQSPPEWIRDQADAENVSLQVEDGEEISEEKKVLNGMQYASKAVGEVLQLPNTLARGKVSKQKGEDSWTGYYGVLRPEALLLYVDESGHRPEVILPIKEGTTVSTVQVRTLFRFNQLFGFHMSVETSPTGVVLACRSEVERSKWMAEIQDACIRCEGRRRDEGRRLKEREAKQEAFKDYDMMTFGDESAKSEGKARHSHPVDHMVDAFN